MDMTNKKQNISVRLSESDIRKIKGISERLGVKESELFRYIIRNALARLLPFQQDGMSGVDLIPALLDSGVELAQRLDIDSDRLEVIVNEGISDQNRRVAKEDLDLLALLGNDACREYLAYKLGERMDKSVEDKNIEESFKGYLYGKYLAGEPLKKLRREEIAVV